MVVVVLLVLLLVPIGRVVNMLMEGTKAVTEKGPTMKMTRTLSRTKRDAFLN